MYERDREREIMRERVWERGLFRLNLREILRRIYIERENDKQTDRKIYGDNRVLEIKKEREKERRRDRDMES